MAEIKSTLKPFLGENSNIGNIAIIKTLALTLDTDFSSIFLTPKPNKNDNNEKTVKALPDKIYNSPIIELPKPAPLKNIAELALCDINVVILEL